MVDFRQLIQAGLHFGHQTSRWCPKMAPYIWGHRSGIHLLDVSKIAHNLDQASNFLSSVAAEGKTILWVGTKKPAKDVVTKVANELSMPYVNHRWVGGTVTNYAQVKKAVTKFLHLEDVVEKADKDDKHTYTKKELAVFLKEAARSKRVVGGLTNLKMPLGAIVLVDVKKEHTALLEAQSAGVPVVALVDSNSDPSGVDYVIPGNDDSPKSIKFVLDYLASGVAKGVQEAKEKAKQQAEQRAQKEEARKAAAKSDDKKAGPKKSAAKSTTAKKTSSSAAKTAKKEEAPKKQVEKKVEKEKATAKVDTKKTEKK